MSEGEGRVSSSTLCSADLRWREASDFKRYLPVHSRDTTLMRIMSPFGTGFHALLSLLHQGGGAVIVKEPIIHGHSADVRVLSLFFVFIL